MNWSSVFSWFAAAMRPGTRDEHGSDDRGDMGTAFGLDASIAPWDASDEPGDAASAEAASSLARRIVRRSAF